MLPRQVVAEIRPAVVFHLAALHFIPYCVAHPSETLLVNVVGTQLVLDALATVPDARLVSASTADVYARADALHAEDDAIAHGERLRRVEARLRGVFELARRLQPARRIVARAALQRVRPGRDEPTRAA